jgi:DNA-binding NarL/FixJ family response regulator
MLKTLLIKLGLSLFQWLPLERIVAKVLTAAIQRIMLSKKTAAQIAQIRKTVIHLTELVQLIDPMLADKAVTGDEAKEMFDALNKTRLEILQLWADGESAKQLEAQLPN